MRFTTSILLLACLSWTPTTQGQVREEEQDERVRPSAQRSSGEQSLDLSRVAELIVQQTNDFRRKQDLAPVKADPKLRETAQYFADYMARTDTYGHTADGQRPSQRASEHGYEYCIVSENIAYAYRSRGFTEQQLAEQFVQGWIDSPEHRENMVDPAVSEIGVAVAHSEESGHYYAVQMFGRPRSASIQFEVANESEQEIRYRIGERSYSLPPRFNRTHRQCRPGKLSFLTSDAAADADKSAKTVDPDSGDRFIVRQAQKEIQVEETQLQE
ncbi:MAG: CAP domain-containing protein [Planctomycetes bacterium]|nr:CAP domain-containing protein [Planctomycetota bacterium]